MKDILLAIGVVFFAYYFLVFLCVVCSFIKSYLTDSMVKNCIKSGDMDFPRLTVIKPLKGKDSWLYGNLESFFLQDYPGYLEIILAVRSEKDAALSEVAKLKEDHPNVKVRVVVSQPENKITEKLNNILSALSIAEGEVMLFSDADVYLRNKNVLKNIVAYLGLPGVAAVCSGYSQTNISTSLINRIFSFYISWGSTLLQTCNVFKRDFFLGGFFCARKSLLESIGSFDGISKYITEDFALARKIIRRTGLKCVFTFENVLVRRDEDSFSGWNNRLARYFLSCRIIMPMVALMIFPVSAFFLFFLVLYGIFTGYFLIASCMFISASLLRSLMLIIANYINKVNKADLTIFLFPLVDLLIFKEGLFGFFDRRVEWGDYIYKVNKKGVIIDKTLTSETIKC